MNYQSAADKLGKRDSRKLENNTYLQRRGELFAVRFHATDVVTIYPDDTYTLETGGWYSKTTAERINTYSPALIRVLRGKWRIARNGKSERHYPGPLHYERTVEWGERQPVTPNNRAYYAAVREWEAANLLPFADGVRVDAAGRVLEPATLPAEAPTQTTASWDRQRGGWDGPVTYAENRQAHQERIAALMGGLRTMMINPRACPHYIMVPEHYRADGTCKCDDPNDPNMAEWGYTWNGEAWA